MVVYMRYESRLGVESPIGGFVEAEEVVGRVGEGDVGGGGGVGGCWEGGGGLGG